MVARFCDDCLQLCATVVTLARTRGVPPPDGRGTHRALEATTHPWRQGQLWVDVVIICPPVAAGRSGAGARAPPACPTADMRTSAEDAIGSQASSAGVPHTDRTGGRRPFSSAEAAGAALERRPSRPLSLPRSTRRALGHVPECLRDERDGRARGRRCERGGSRGCDAREGPPHHPWAPQHPPAEGGRKGEAAPPANQDVGARAAARGGCGGPTDGDGTAASCQNHPRATTPRARGAEGPIPRCEVGPRGANIWVDAALSEALLMPRRASPQ